MLKIDEPTFYLSENKSIMTLAQISSTFGLICLMAGCIGRPPLRTYTIARIALESAKKSEGFRAAPEDMHMAEESYRKGEFYYRNKDYSSAAEEFEKTIQFAEGAENAARLNRKN